MSKAWGGSRKGAGRKPNPNKEKIVATPKLRPPPVPAEPAKPIDYRAMAAFLPDLQKISEQYSVRTQRKVTDSPFRPALHPQKATPPNAAMAMDNGLIDNGQFAETAWLAQNSISGYASEGLVFPGYPTLSELAQRPEYRVISETIADDATRKWIDFDVAGDENENRRRAENDPVGEAERMADPDERKKRVRQAGKTDKVKALVDDQARLEVASRFYDLCRYDGFFGRSHLYIDLGTNDPKELAMPIGSGRDKLSEGKIGQGSLKALRVIEPVWTYPMAYNSLNPLREDWYNPQVWYVMGQEIHVSRLPTFIGHPVPDLLKPAYSFGGLSLTQMAIPYVDIWLRTRQSVADIIHSFSVMVLMTDLSTMIQPETAANLMARVAMFNMLRDNQGTFVVNKNTEDFKNVSASLAGLHELQAQAQEHMAAVSRIPLVKLTGISPSGLNASSEGEIMVYDDTIGAYQNRFMRPNLTKVINFEQLSLWGEVDPEITFKFNPLRVLTEKERGEKQDKDAERHQKYVDMGALAPGEVRKVIIDDPELPYTGLDPDDVPDLADEEAAGLEPEGGRPDPAATGAASKPEGAKPAAKPGVATDEWQESKHPRRPDGKFGSGGASGGSKKQPAEAAAEPQERPSPKASSLYQAPTKTADEIVAAFPGGAEAIQKTRERLAKVVPSNALVENGGFKNPDGTYTEERQALHNRIVDEMFAPEKIAAARPAPGEKPTMVMLGGRGGSGKSWLTGDEGPVDASKMILIDADHIKSMLPGYEGWNASAYHEESSDILKLVDDRALGLGVHTVLDATLKSESSSAQRMALYEAAGYEVEGYYMYAAPEEAATRAMSRYSKGGKFNGRFVPPEIVLSNTENEKNFDKLSSGFKKWAVYDNNTLGQKPRLVSKSD